ncbi:MAG: MFS transporter [Firmicutes bacterium]|nr:MFS transporter [Bacillota bacterium]
MRIRMIDQYRGLPGPVYILMIARIVIAMGTFVYPFLTMFLSSRIGMNDQEVSRYLLLVALAQLPANLIGGKLADRFPRKRVYGAAMFCSASFFALSGFFCQSANVVWLILAGYFFSNMSHPVLSAMIMDVTTEKNRQESFSLVYLGFNMGYAIGPLVAGLLFEEHTPWIFWGQAILVSTAVSLILLRMPLRPTAPEKEREEAVTAEAPRQESLWKLLRHDPVMLIFAACLTCYAFSYAQISYLMPLDLELHQGISAAAKSISMVWSLNGVVVFLATPLVVLLTKRNSSILNCALGGLIYLLGFGGTAFTAGRTWLLLSLVLVWTVGEILCNTNSGVFIANHAPASHRARYQSIYDIIQNLGKAAGPFLMGFYLLGHSYQQGWLFVSGLCLLAALGLILLQRHPALPPEEGGRHKPQKRKAAI